MFEVTVRGDVVIEGCPQEGVDAVEWRERHDLPLEPTNKVRLEWKAEDRAFCTDPSVRDCADRYADVNVFQAADPFRYCDEPDKYTPSLPPDVVRPFLSKSDVPSTDDLLALWGAACAAQAVRIAPLCRQVEELANMGDGELLQRILQEDGVPRWWGKLGGDDFYERAVALYRQHKEDGVRRERESQARKEQERAEEERRRQELIAAWVQEHGSERLRRLCAEGIECEAVYTSERITLEYPGWRRYSKVRGSDEEPRNASEMSLQFLDGARASSPKAAGAVLRYWIAEEDWDREGELREEWRGYVAMVEDDDLGVLVYGGPETLA